MDTKLHTRGGGSNEIPDYYLGMLVFYDEFSDDNCKWVVYDGMNKIRCPTRRDAMNYIAERKTKDLTPDIFGRIIDARISLNRTIELLDTAAQLSGGLEKTLLERLAVRLRPVLVEIDNVSLN